MFPQALSLPGSEQMKIESREHAERKNQGPYCVQSQVDAACFGSDIWARMPYAAELTICKSFAVIAISCAIISPIREAEGSSEWSSLVTC
jgi:hypothetical protein